MKRSEQKEDIMQRMRTNIIVALALAFLILYSIPALSLIETDKPAYSPGDAVSITISGYDLSGKDISISEGANNYKFIGAQNSITFFPKNEGTYNILVGENGRAIDSNTFTVKRKTVLNQINPSNTQANGQVTLNNLPQPGQPEPASQGDAEASNPLNQTSQSPNSQSGNTSQASPSSPSVFSRILNFANFSKMAGFFSSNSQNHNSNSIRADGRTDFSANEKPRLAFKKNTNDLSKIKIRVERIKDSSRSSTSETIEEKTDYRITSSNGDIQVELDTKRKFRPGMYKIILDDGTTVQEKLFSFGLISMNTKKPLYHPNETADIYLVVLDKNGFKRSNAYIELNITDPALNTYLFTTNHSEDLAGMISYIREISPGVYTISMPVNFEGNYSLSATTFFEDINASASTYFMSSQYYEFDILRNAPHVIDPWLGPFKNTFNIISFTSASTFDLVEFVPAEFEITNTNAEVSIVNETKMLVWRGLTNNSFVSYSAQTPLITPYLYTLGQAQIIYPANGQDQANTFNEARPWYLAIDPTINFKLNETSTASFTAVPANITMGLGDATENNAQVTIPATSLRTFAIVNSSAFGNNGIFIPAGTSMNFGGTFQSNRATNTYVTWMVRMISNGADTPICQIGNNNTGGSQIGVTNNARYNVTASCTAPTGIRLNSTDFLKMYVNIYNSRAGTNTPVHRWDGAGTASYISFNAYLLGFMFTNLTNPTTQQNLVENDTFIATCVYNCTGGSCLNTNISIQANVSGAWTNIRNAGYNLVLDGAESNPHVFGEVNAYSTDTFSLRTNATGMTAIRCVGTSDFSNYNGTQNTLINITMQNYAPIVSGNISDQGSNKTNPTPAGTNVRFTANATDINADSYKLLICTTNSTTAGSCTATTICQSGFIASGLNNTCAHSTTGESGAYPWFGFVCDNQPTPLCSLGQNGTGINGTPYYVNNAPTITNINASRYFSRLNDAITMSSIGAADQESDNLQIICGNETGKYTLCASAFGPSERTCQFNDPWNDNTIHTIYCALNDSWTISTENKTDIFTDNINPVIHLNTTNNSYFNAQSIILNYTLIDANPSNCSLYINTSGWDLNQTMTGIISNELSSFNAIALLDGFYRWNVLCSDQAENNASGINGNYSFAVDTTGPNVTWMYPGNISYLFLHNVTFKYNATDLISNVSNCELIFDFEPNETSIGFNRKTINSTFNIPNVTNGEHNWSINCTDILGNAKSSDTYNFKTFVDEFPPNITHISPPDLTWTNIPDVTLEYNVSDDSNISYCSLWLNYELDQTNDTVENNIYNYFYLYSLAEGEYTWTIECVDNSSMHNSADSIYPWIFFVDTTPPMPTIETPDQEWFATNEPIIYFHIDDGLSTDAYYNFTVDGTYDPNAAGLQATGISLSVMLTALSDGNHTYILRTTDLAGNEENSSAYTLYIDTVSPNATIDTPLNGTFTNDNTPEMNFTVFDDTSPYINYSILIDSLPNGQTGNATNNTQTSIDLTALSEGERIITINTTDIVSNSRISRSINLIVDLTPPYALLNQPLSGSNISSGTIDMNFTGFDNLAESLSCNLTIDNTIEFAGIHAIIGQETGVAKSGLADGVHSWNVTCADNATNKNTSETWNFLIDTIQPNVTLISPANNSEWTGSQFVLFEYNTSDSSSVSRCDLVINEAVQNSTQNPLQDTKLNFTWALGNGEYNWTINCTDISGNTGTGGRYNLSVYILNDLVAPTISTFFPPDGYWNSSGNVTFNYSASDQNNVSNCSLIMDGAVNQTNNDIVNNQNYQFNISQLSEGMHSWFINCTDNSTNNNTGSTLAKILKIDKSAPYILQNAPPDGFNTSRSYLSLNYTANDNMATKLFCSITLDSANAFSNWSNPGQKMNYTAASLIEGYHYWNVTCIDNATNSNTSGTRKFTNDYTGPTINLENPANNTYYMTSYNVTFFFNTSDALTSTTNCSLIVDNIAVQKKTNITDLTQENISKVLSAGQHNWSVNCTDIVGNTESSFTWNLTIANLQFINPIHPDNNIAIDRDSVNPTVDDNQTILMLLTNDIGGTPVTIKANLTAPQISGQRNIIIAIKDTDTTGNVTFDWNGTDSNGQKMYAGNYTLWAEADDYLGNGTRIAYIYGGLNLTYRFPADDPTNAYGENRTARFDMFLKSLGPESDVQVNGTYLANVTLNLTKPNSANAYVNLIDPDIEETALPKTIQPSNDSISSEEFLDLTGKNSSDNFNREKHMLGNWKNQIIKIGNDRFKLGVIAINSEKEKYAEGEDALMKVAVLDEKGYLSERDDFSIILKKDGEKIGELKKDDLTNTNLKGVYEFGLNLTSGDYLLEGLLDGKFIVQNNLKIVKTINASEPEIIRKTQIVIDPAKEPVSTEIKVKNVERFNITEKMPKEFSIIESTSTGIIENKEGKTLSWNNASNNTIIRYTAKVPLISPYLHTVGKAKIYYDGNIYEENRPWIIAIDPTQSYQFNETSGASFTNALAQISLGTYDGGANQVQYAIPNGAATQIVNATSAVMGENGIYIPNGNSIIFTGTFIANNANRAYVTWVAQKNSNGILSPICQAGNNNTLGTVVLTARNNRTDSCSSPGIWLNGTDQLVLRINVFRSNTVTVTHYWDVWATTQSNIAFNAYKLGFMFTNLTNPTTQQNLIENDTFTATCAYNCTGGSCLNTNISIQANVSGAWTNIRNAGYNLILDGAEANPHTYTEVNTFATTTFSLRTNATGMTAIRCVGTSDFSNYNGTQNTLINITMQNYAPIVSGNISDQGSNKTNPTPAGTNVKFTANATDINADSYKLLICTTNSTTAGSCTATTICQSGFVASGLNNTCVHSTTGESGAYPWFGFVCDNQPTPLCSLGQNGTGINGTPYYVNNAPTITNINASRYFSRLNDAITMSSIGAADQESDNLQIICGNETGKYTLCASAFGPGERTCQFSMPWNDNTIHTIYCALNDSFAISAEKTTTILTDNTIPIVQLNISNISYFKSPSVVLNYTLVDANPSNCLLYTNMTDWSINQTMTGIITNTLKSFNAINLIDGHYTWNVWCLDNSSNSANAIDGNYTFTVDTMRPFTNLISPDHDFRWITGLDITFQYNVDDETTNIRNCSLIINNKINATTIDVEKGSVQEFLIPMGEGIYNWSVNCTDYAGNTNYSEKRNLTVNVSGDLTAPTVSLNSPANNYWNNTGDFAFFYTPDDNSAVMNCSLMVDGEINQTDNTISMGVQNSFILNDLASGWHDWTVNCSDFNQNTAEPAERIFGTDALAPALNLEGPANNSQWTSSDRVSFSYNTSDEHSGLSYCSLIVNKTIEATHYSIAENITQSFLSIMANGQYSWSINCTDIALNTNSSKTYYVTVNTTLKHWLGNKTLSQDIEGLWNITAEANARWFFIANNSGKQFVYDVTGPNITIISPLNNTKITGTNVTFRYNVTDNYVNISNCSITIDSQYLNTSWNLTQNETHNFTTILPYKNHTYSIECYDILGNKKETGILNFNITYIDLMINSTSINFSTDSPIEGTNITAFAKISNLGDENAGTFITKFYEGNPSLGGVQLGTDVIINSLNALSSITVNRTWTARQGTYDIYVIIDTPLEINGSVPEIDETNNKNFSTIMTPIWQYYFGNISEGRLFLDLNSSETIASWNTTRFSGNIYAADTDNTIDWLSLKALGWDASNNPAYEDFEEADIGLNTTNRTDSINKTFIQNNIPINMTEFEVFGINITNVSYVPSTNTDEFITAILWDSSQKNNYNGSQDIVFATKINQAKTGMYGDYDYEMRLPANLKNYKPSADSIAFYTDIE